MRRCSAPSDGALPAWKADLLAMATSSHLFWRGAQQVSRQRLAHWGLLRVLGCFQASSACVHMDKFMAAPHVVRADYVLDHYCDRTWNRSSAHYSPSSFLGN